MAQAEVVDASLGMGDGGSTLSAPTVADDAAWRQRHTNGKRELKVADAAIEDATKTEGFRLFNVAVSLAALTCLFGSAAWIA